MGLTLIFMLFVFHQTCPMASGDDGDDEGRQGIRFDIQNVEIVGTTFVVTLSYDATGTIKWHTGQDVEVDQLQDAWVKAYFFDEDDPRAFDLFQWVKWHDRFFPKPWGADTTIGTAIHHSGVAVHDVKSLGGLHMFTEISPMSGSIEIVLDYARYVEVGHAYDVLLIASIDFNGHGQWDPSWYMNGGNYDSLRPIDLEIRHNLSLKLDGPQSIAFIRDNNRVLLSQKRPFLVTPDRYYAPGDAKIEDSIYFEVQVTDLGQTNMDEVSYLWKLGIETESEQWVMWEATATRSKQFYLRDETLSTQKYLDRLVSDVAPDATLRAYLLVEAYSSHETVSDHLVVKGERIGESNAKVFEVRGLDLRIVGPDRISPQDGGAVFHLEGAELAGINIEEVNWTFYLQSPDRYADWLIIQDTIENVITEGAELTRKRTDLDSWTERIVWLTFTNPRILGTPSEADVSVVVSIRTNDGEWPWLLARPLKFVVASSPILPLLGLCIIGLRTFAYSETTEKGRTLARRCDAGDL